MVLTYGHLSIYPNLYFWDSYIDTLVGMGSIEPELYCILSHIDTYNIIYFMPHYHGNRQHAEGQYIPCKELKLIVQRIT